MVEAPKSPLELSDHVEALDREWPGDGDRLEHLLRHVVLLGVVLTTLACPDGVQGISNGGRLVEVMSERLPHDGPWHRVVSADAAWMSRSSFFPSSRVTHRRSTLVAL